MDKGRPIEWTPEKKQNAIDEIFYQIIEENKSLNSIIKNSDRETIPSTFTFFQWLKEDAELAKNYTRACEIRAEKIFDEMLEIADTTVEGVVIEIDDNGRTKEKKGDMLGHRRLQIDARKWILSKMNPKKYSDKVDITTDGNEIKQTPTIINLGSGIKPE